MNTYSMKIGNKLNQLLEKTYAAEQGFAKAAEHTDHLYLKGYFTKKAEQRFGFGHQLKEEIKSFGPQVEKGNSFIEKAHSTWLDVKALFLSNSEEAMLEEAIEGEKAAIAEYEAILKDVTLPPSTEMILRDQKGSIEAGLSTIQKLETIR